MPKYDPDEFFHHKKPGLVEPRYISPIQITLGQIQNRFDNEVFRAVLNVGIEVDKEELIKALNYDRAQYAQGYADGLMGKPFAKDTNVRSNADRIRQMSDEELAAFFNDDFLCPPGYATVDGMLLTDKCVYHNDSDDEPCRRCWLDWLQQEAET